MDSEDVKCFLQKSFERYAHDEQSSNVHFLDNAGAEADLTVAGAIAALAVTLDSASVWATAAAGEAANLD
jgi:hypothetical protein